MLSPAAVLIENDKIKEVGAPANSKRMRQPKCTTIDLDAATLLPGLIDSHTHLLVKSRLPAEVEISTHYIGEFAPGMLLAIIESPNKRRVDRRADGARRFGEWHYNRPQSWSFRHRWRYSSCATRSTPAVSRPKNTGVCTQTHYPRAHTFRTSIPRLAEAILEQEFLFIEGTDRSAGQAVRENGFQERRRDQGYGGGRSHSPAEMAAVVEEAHRQQLKVAVHAVTAPNIQIAIDAGADSIEHGNGATDEQLKTMRNKGIFLDLTPTFYGGFLPKTSSTCEHRDVIQPVRSWLHDWLALNGAAAISTVWFSE